MRNSYLDNLPEDVQRAIYMRFKRANLKDKIIFLSRLEYGNDLSYRNISDKVGISTQRVQYIVDSMFTDIKENVLSASGMMPGLMSGVL